MTLQPKTDTPGLWVNDAWKPGTRGAFALVIGVSTYDHLPGGKGPFAKKTYGLQPLYVSALTAYRFFRWLCDTYAYDGNSLSYCWLLLSPTKEELDVEPRLGDHLLRPTFGNCEQAIEHWFSIMGDLAHTSAVQSRAFFFFSGHGLEVTTDRQILLPCDYLRPPHSSVNRAMSTYNLQAGMAALAVPDQFFFLDACRNDTLALRQEEDLEGARILNVSRAVRNHSRHVPIFYASASGTLAWQPTAPALGPSVFGQALLEGLQPGSNFPKANCKRGLCELRVHTLHAYLVQRVPVLLKALNTPAEQFIPPVSSYDIPITQFRRRFNVAPQPTVKPATELPIIFDVDNQESTAGLSDHDILGSEHMTNIWQGGVKLWSFQHQEWLPDNQAYLLHRVERDEGTRVYRIVLSAREPGAHWFQLSDALTTFACVLPAGDSGPARYTLDLTFEYDSYDEHGAMISPRHISRLNVGLDESNEGILGTAAKLWWQHNALADPEMLSATAGFAREALSGKLGEPLAATVIALILLRYRQINLAHSWIDDLARWFPELPDRHVLRVEQLLQDNVLPPQPAELATRLLALSVYGLPQTADGLSHALHQADELLKVLDNSIPEYKQLVLLQKQLHHLLRFFRSGGLFAVFASPHGSAKLTPNLVQPRN